MTTVLLISSYSELPTALNSRLFIISVSSRGEEFKQKEGLNLQVVSVWTDAAQL